MNALFLWLTCEMKQKRKMISSNRIELQRPTAGKMVMVSVDDAKDAEEEKERHATDQLRENEDTAISLWID